MRELLLRLKCAKIQLQASTINFRNFATVLPRTPVKRGELLISYVTVQIIINLINFRW
jgi:hypothetical protein